MMVTDKGIIAALRRLKMEKNMKSKIVVYSSANVYELPDVGFAYVPLKILTDEQEYVDTAEVDAPALAEMMRSYKGRTSTSCPNISDWMAAYEGADEVYVVTMHRLRPRPRSSPGGWGPWRALCAAARPAGGSKTAAMPSGCRRRTKK